MKPLKEFYPRHLGMGCSQHKTFYLYIPKCGSTSIRKEMGHSGKDDTINIKDKLWLDTFTIIRNPYTRIVSTFFELRKREKVKHAALLLDAFIGMLEDIDKIDDIHVYPQADFVRDYKIDRIYLMEDYPFKSHERRTEEIAKKKCLLNYIMFDKEIRKAIEKIYSEDIELYGKIYKEG